MLRLFAAVVLLVVLAGAARADHRFHEQAGFAATPVTVTDHHDYPVRKAVEAWNETAGREVLRVVADGGQVTVTRSDRQHSWALPEPWRGPYEACVVAIADNHRPIAERVLTHELGHCLGFDDHPYDPARFDSGDGCGPGPYKGVLSYCVLRLTAEDVAMMEGFPFVAAAAEPDREAGSEPGAETNPFPEDCPASGLSDTVGASHERAIDCLVAWGIAHGRADGTFGADEPVTRGQMAAFLVRLVEAMGEDG